MEVIMKMISIFAYIGIVVGPIMIAAGVYLVNWYQDSIDRLMDRMQGYERDYTSLVRTGLLITILALVYLIAKHT